MFRSIIEEYIKKEVEHQDSKVNRVIDVHKINFQYVRLDPLSEYQDQGKIDTSV